MKTRIVSAGLVVFAIVALVWVMKDADSDSMSAPELAVMERKKTTNSPATESVQVSKDQTLDSSTLSSNDKKPFFTEKMEYDSDWCNGLQLSEQANLVAEDEHNQWLTRHGYTLENKNAYASYSQETLKELMSQGDTTAMVVLTEKGNKETQLDASYEAAVYGLTGPSLLPILMDFEIQADKLKEAGQLEDAKKMYMKSLAWQQFATLRGDYIHMKGTVYRLRTGKVDYEIESDDFDQISDMAEEIYDELNGDRLSRQMEPFSSSVPKVVENLNNLTFAAMKANGWDGWGSQFVKNNDCVKKNTLFLTSKDQV